MKWLKALKIGLTVLDVLDKAGVRVKGVPIGVIKEKVEDALTSTKTVGDIRKETSK